MHYYQFKIGDYIKSTSHLTPLEDIAYRRMLDRFYDSELPLPSDIYKLARLLRMPDNQSEILVVLDEFWEEIADGWINKKGQECIDEYQRKADVARSNGHKGGRPKGDNDIVDLNSRVIPKESGDKHFLYLIYDTKKNEIKIGETTNLIKRRYSIKRPTANLVISNFWILDTFDAQELERNIKKEFAEYRINGDWFVYSNELENKITDYVENKTGLDNLANQNERVLKAKQEPLNTNHKPVTNNQVINTPSTSRFNEFWNLYDKKSDKAKCEKKFAKLKPSDIDKIFFVLRDYVNSTPDLQYRKNPITWLNGECWNDEIKPVGQQKIVNQAQVQYKEFF